MKITPKLLRKKYPEYWVNVKMLVKEDTIRTIDAYQAEMVYDIPDAVKKDIATVIAHSAAFIACSERLKEQQLKQAEDNYRDNDGTRREQKCVCEYRECDYL